MKDPRSAAEYGVVVLASGSGSRWGTSEPKALTLVAGRSLPAHTLVGLAAAGLPPAVVVYPPGCRDVMAASIAELPVDGFVPGGGTRTRSVIAGQTPKVAFPDDLIVLRAIATGPPVAAQGGNA